VSVLQRPATAAGREGLDALLADPSRALVALDYDGTLAPVVLKPEDAVPQAGAVEALTAVAGLVGQVALVTGRDAEDVLTLGGVGIVPGLVVLGQYGAQRWHEGVLVQEPPAPGLEHARRVLAELITEPGVSVEDKGLSLVVHTRQAAEPVEALTHLYAPLATLATRLGLELHTGRLVLEMRPQGYDKGRALVSLAQGVSAVLFAGDDVGDLAAFDAVDTLRDAGIPGLLVCSDSEETPGELRDRADLVVAGPPGVVHLLEELAGQL